MSIDDIRTFCLSLPYVEETMPFDDSTLVYKVGGRMFAMTDLVRHDRVVVKCDPDMAIELRDRHEEITAAWHLNKRHWNDVLLYGDLSPTFILEQVYNSYMLVIRHNVVPVALRREILDAAQGVDLRTLCVVVSDIV